MPLPLTLIVGDRDLTREVESLTFSNVDPGGFETLQAQPRTADGFRPGQRTTVRYGLDVAWDGRLNEPGEHSKYAKKTGQLAALGYGARLKDNPYSMVYVDRDLTAWREMSTQRRINYTAAAEDIQSFHVGTDPAAGVPSLTTSMVGTWTLVPVCEAWYDAGQGNVIGSVYYSTLAGGNVDPADSKWHWNVGVAADSDGTSGTVSGELRAASASGYYTPPGVGRFAFVYHSYDSGAGAQGANYDVFWRNLAVYGRHGLPTRGSDPGGFYPSDIALHALGHASGIAQGVVETASGLIVPHSVYRTPTAPEQVIDDMAKLMGWHWGVWEPATILDDTPTFHFRSPPTDATVIASRSELDDLDAPKVRLDTLYDTAIVSYHDPAGTQGAVTVTLANPLLADTGEGPRTMALDMGLGDATSATTFGQFALQLAQTGARGGGSCIVPANVRVAGGGSKPACLLKAGRDRIRIIDLPDSGPWTEVDTRRYDTFRIKRVETTVQQGVPQTRIEFDGGADLLEVLQARLALTAQIVGA